ncbi:hypothetical protein [Nocardia transvalensis]|uniref:hypothetical protein n=1 Tax=Nocardia transvalensis TaxID=37333 RepID=UPI001894A11B|nr:hypothetical protein [Nocardia transvalensis]MBF6328765.1 hypothetical protein [Nocardia transvalensis]
MTTTSVSGLCPFPTGPDKVCGRTVAQRSGPGRPRTYCDDPKHNAVNRLRADRRYRDRAATAAADTGPQRPVTERAQSLVGALARIEELKAELLAELADTEQLAADLVDPQLVALELEQVQREAAARVDQARAAQAAAEHDALQARRARDEALELQRVALEAAEEAIATRDAAVEAVSRMRADCEQEVARVAAVADAEISTVHAERDQAEAERDAAVDAAEKLRAALETAQTRHHDELAAVRAVIQWSLDRWSTVRPLPMSSHATGARGRAARLRSRRSRAFRGADRAA